MADNVQSLMFEILKQIQADVSSLKVDVSALKADVADIRVRVERLEEQGKKHRRDSAAILVMMRGTVGEFDGRLRDVENDVRVLMEHD
jgi:predicted  nucleic acid-binding Zn-ribbon protein